MPRIIVIASRARTVGSAVIRASQAWRAWSHTSDVITVGGYVETVEALAIPGRVVRRSVADLRQRSSESIVLSREVSSDAAAMRDRLLIEQVGHGYDYTGAALAGWAQWRQWDDPGRWWCSELTAWAAAQIGALQVSPYIRGVMPTQCVDLLLAAGWGAAQA